MKLKSAWLIVAACGLGSWMLWSGLKEYKNVQRLIAQGQNVDAQVLDHSVQFRRRGGTRYYLLVQFQPAASQPVQERVRVSHDEYLKDQKGSTVTVRYLPLEPAICAVGEPVAAWKNKLAVGGLLVLCGCALPLLGSGLTTRQAAEKIVSRMGGLCEERFDYAPASARDFGHLDLAWYDASQRWLENNGFAWLGDEENLTFRRTSQGNRTLLRTFLGRDGTWLAYLYHFKPASPAAVLGASGARILELQTRFANGTFVCTSNAEAAGKLDSPPGVDAARLPANTSLEEILGAHARRVAACLNNNSGLAAVRLGTLEDVHESQNVLQGIKAAHRRTTGLTKEELARLASNRLAPEQVAALHAEIAKVQSEHGREPSNRLAA